MFDYEKNGIIKGIQGIKKRYVNYHHHTYYSNPIAGADSSISPISFIKRAIELGHTTITTCEHGSSLSFLEYYGYIDYVKKNKNKEIVIDFRNKFNLVFAVEAYFVIDNLTKDRTNAHIVLVAKNDNGRKAINRLCSKANEFGFYGRPRASLSDIMELPANDVIITTACLAGVWRYNQPFNPYQNIVDDYNNYKTTFEQIEQSENPEDIISLCFKNEEEYLEKKKNYEIVKNNINDINKTYDYITILKMWKEHFKDNLYLEIQSHNTEKQLIINKLIKQVSKELDIPLIAGCDSHANTQKDVETREVFIYAKKDGRPEDEIGWYVDYPDYETLKQRFLDQNIFSEEEIENAIDNTLIFETCEQPYISKDIKLPTIYPNLSQEEKNKLFEDLIWNLWEKRKLELIEFNKKWYKKEEVIPFQKYVDEIKKELLVVIETSMTDYFLFNYHMIKNAIEKYGGVLTKTGRGSGGSFYLNNLLGFTSIDRIFEKVPMLSERFMSKSRILETKSLPDIDFNTAGWEAFQKAQQELLGEYGSYFMITYGQYKTKAAFKMYCRAENLDFDIANKISKQIEEFEEALKHAEDDEKEFIKIEDYVAKEYLKYIEASKDYEGIIDNISQSPCSFILLNDDIREEIGITRIKKKDGDILVANITGKQADELKYLKNDILIVSTVLVTNEICKRIGIKQPSVRELIEITKNRMDIFEKVYGDGNTCVINQVEKPNAIKKLKIYKPKSIEEITAFVSAIRPSFKSSIDTFLNRRPFNYGVPAFDKVIQGEYQKDSFLLYQEAIMKSLSYAHIPSDETYSIIKAISKKKEELIKSYKDQFLIGFTKEANCDSSTSEKVWKIIEDASAYGFNSAHAFAVACDSLYNAWLKVDYPYEFYETCLKIYSGEIGGKKDKDKMAMLIKEMQFAFNIKLGDMKWGSNNSSFVEDKENHVIYPSLMSVKYMKKDTLSTLYDISKQNIYNDFVDIFMCLSDKENKIGIDRRMLSTLVSIGYFNYFGSRKKIDKFLEIIERDYSKKTYNKEKTANSILNIVKKFARSGLEEDKKTYRDIDFVNLYKYIWNMLPNEEYSIEELIFNEYNLTGQLITKLPNDITAGVIVAKSYTKPWILFSSLKNGAEIWIMTRNKVSEIPPKESLVILKNISCEKSKFRTTYIADVEAIVF